MKKFFILLAALVMFMLLGAGIELVSEIIATAGASIFVTSLVFASLFVAVAGIIYVELSKGKE